MKHRFNRRKVLSIGSAVGAGAALMGSCSKLSGSSAYSATPPQIEGPFYPIEEQKDKDADLTQIEGSKGIASGTLIQVQGEVVNEKGEAIEGAVVDIWQANSHGRYAHPDDSNDAPLDPNFQGWAVLKSSTEGKYSFRTIKPGAYPLSANALRTPHIHFKVSKDGYKSLTTQMYFPGESLNKSDFLYRKLSASEKEQVTAQSPGGMNIFNFQIVLAIQD